MKKIINWIANLRIGIAIGSWSFGFNLKNTSALADTGGGDESKSESKSNMSLDFHDIVVAMDNHPNPNMGTALGIPDDRYEYIKATMKKVFDEFKVICSNERQTNVGTAKTDLFNLVISHGLVAQTPNELVLISYLCGCEIVREEFQRLAENSIPPEIERLLRGGDNLDTDPEDGLPDWARIKPNDKKKKPNKSIDDLLDDFDGNIDDFLKD